VAAQQRAVDAAFRGRLQLRKFGFGHNQLCVMLQAQLTANASLNAALLSRGTTKKSPTTSSYLFSAKDANTLDADAVFHLAKAAFAAYAAIRRSIQPFEEPLFSQAAKAIDRTRLTVAENERLDNVIGRCLLVLSQDLLESSVSKLIEWLVRHFRYAPPIFSQRSPVS
jgi:U3 small nucleolar RNA-associated protein 10